MLKILPKPAIMLKARQKMQRAVRKLQNRISNNPSRRHSYQTLSATQDVRASSEPCTSCMHLRCSSLVKIKSISRSASSSNQESSTDDSVTEPAEDADDQCIPSDVAAGCLAVYVGQERQRFVINAQNLNHAVFRCLLQKSAEEYGFNHNGGLFIACEVVLFEHVLWLIETNDPSLCTMEIDELVGFYAYT